MIVGITGNKLAGKGVVMKHLEQRGFDTVSLSDMIRQELTVRGLEHSRTNLIEVGNELREAHGAGVLAEMVIKRTSTNPNLVVDSIRNPEEVKVLREAWKTAFRMISIDAPVEARYERSISRERNENSSSLEEFMALEDLENSSNPNGQQLKKTMELADVHISNAGTLQELEHELFLFLLTST